jgi:hypothetical protein
MYVRFVLQGLNSSSGRRNGFFDAAYDLRNAKHTPDYTTEHLADLIAWFEKNLTTPSRFNRSSSKGAFRRNGMALSWFKPTAKEHLEKAHELCAVLREHGYAITILKTDKPGFIVCEDADQIVAEPLADSPT